MNKISFVVFGFGIALSSTGCFVHKDNDPVNSTFSISSPLGGYSSENKMTFWNECKRDLAQGRPADPVTNRPQDMNLLPKDTYNSCLAMLGKRTAPVPVDSNGDGYTDSYDYGGFRISADYVNLYGIPGYYAPGLVGAGSIGMAPGMWNAGNMQVGGGISTLPNTTVTVQQLPQKDGATSSASPWGSKGDRPVTREEYNALLEQQLRLQLEQDKKKRSEAPQSEGK